MLFADNTNIFVEAKNRMLAYENANKILKAVHLYMLVNKLHINMSKCCFIDFKPDKNVIPDSNLCLKINNVVIKQVNDILFIHKKIKLSFDCGYIRGSRKPQAT